MKNLGALLLSLLVLLLGPFVSLEVYSSGSSYGVSLAAGAAAVLGVGLLYNWAQKKKP